MRYNKPRKQARIRSDHYQALAEFRHQIRRFLNSGEQAARAVGLEPQQYLMLLSVRGLPTGMEPTIRTLAERLQVQHHTAVELVDRLAQRGLVRRIRGKEDRRQVFVRLTARGAQVLEKLAIQRLTELRATGPTLVGVLRRVIAATKRAVGPDRRARRAE